MMALWGLPAGLPVCLLDSAPLFVLPGGPRSHQLQLWQRSRHLEPWGGALHPLVWYECKVLQDDCWGSEPCHSRAGQDSSVQVAGRKIVLLQAG